MDGIGSWGGTTLAGLGIRFFLFGIRVNFTLLLEEQWWQTIP